MRAVTALVTRRTDGGLELCALERVGTGLWLPAGPLEVGEDPLAGASRLAGAAFGGGGLRPVGQVGVLTELNDPPGSLGDDGLPYIRRHLVHLAREAGDEIDELEREMEGGRRRWLEVAAGEGLDPRHRAWLDAARPLLR